MHELSSMLWTAVNRVEEPQYSEMQAELRGDEVWVVAHAGEKQREEKIGTWPVIIDNPAPSIKQKEWVGPAPGKHNL